MFRTALMLATSAAIALTATSGAFAKGKYHLTVSNPNGKVIFDDGVPDGRGCVVGTRAIWSPGLGKFIQIPASKCNF
jgi:hypothetical protein